jgi:TatD DNase family protein
MSLVDIHIHLTDEEYSGYLDHILTTLRAMRMKACSVTVDNETSLRSVSLFNTSHRDTITQFIGIHPLFASKEDVPRFLQILNKNIQFVDGIGEIGLDKTYAINNYSPYDRQIDVFESMLEIAEKHQKPVSIHSRKSLDDILQTLSAYNIRNVLLHWFSGNKKQLRQCLNKGYYVSYGPPLLYSNDKKTLLSKTDKKRFLVETDGPNKYSGCFKNLPSLPTSFLVSVTKCASEVLGISYDETVEILKRNSGCFLNQEIE